MNEFHITYLDVRPIVRYNPGYLLRTDVRHKLLQLVANFTASL